MDSERLAKTADLRRVDDTARFRKAVREGVAQANCGELIENEDVLSWLEARNSNIPHPLD